MPQSRSGSLLTFPLDFSPCSSLCSSPCSLLSGPLPPYPVHDLAFLLCVPHSRLNPTPSLRLHFCLFQRIQWILKVCYIRSWAWRRVCVFLWVERETRLWSCHCQSTNFNLEIGLIFWVSLEQAYQVVTYLPSGPCSMIEDFVSLDCNALVWAWDLGWFHWITCITSDL